MELVYGLLSMLMSLAFFGALVYFAVRLFQKRAGESVEQQLAHIQVPALVLWVVGIAVAGFNIFAYEAVLGIGVGIFLAAGLAGLWLAFARERRTYLVNGLTLVGVLAAVMIGLRANGFVQGFDLALVIVIGMILVLLHSVDEFHWQGLWMLKRIGDYVWQFVRNIFLMPRFSKDLSATGRLNVFTILKTGLFTFLALIIFAEILSGADPVFAEIIREIKEEAAARTIISLFIAVALFLAVSVKLLPDKNEHLRFTWLSLTEIVVPVSAVAALFAVFIFVQAKYLFAGHVDLAAFGLTYSEYARRGFFELMVATFLGGLMVYGVILKQQVIVQTQRLQSLRFLNTILVGELLVMLASALKRDLLYVNAYGLTRTRVVGDVFLFWLAGFLVLLLLLNWGVRFVRRPAGRMKERQFFAGVAGLTLLVFAWLNLINVDRMIALSDAPRDFHNAKDYFYVNSLSEDAVEGWLQSVPYAQKRVGELVQKELLNGDEVYQLVNLKLALIALGEKRDDLDKKYGSREAVEAIVQREYGSRMAVSAKPDMGEPVLVTSPTSDLSTDYVENRFAHLRKWQSVNLSELYAYRTVQANQEWFYGTVDCLIRRIAEYQRDHAVDTLSIEQETLYEIERPFLVNYLHYFPQAYDIWDGQYPPECPSTATD